MATLIVLRDNSGFGMESIIKLGKEMKLCFVLKSNSGLLKPRCGCRTDNNYKVMNSNFRKADSTHVNFSVNDKLHEWEKLECSSAPLSTFQRNVCLDLADVVSSRPFPDSPSSGAVECENQIEECQVECDLKSVHEFLTWYTTVSSEWLTTGDEAQKPYLQKLKNEREKCSDLLHQVEHSVNILEELKLEYEFVSSKTNPLHTASETLSSEQNKLSAILQDINVNLKPFQTIESVIKRLESSVIAVTSSDFILLLDDVDQCSDYFNEHVTFKESSKYALKSRYALSRALDDVKSYITSVLDTCRTVERRVDNSAFLSQYGRFQTTAPRLKPLLSQLETRSGRSLEYGLMHLTTIPLLLCNEKYDNALEHCQKYYTNIRQDIIVPHLKESITQLTESRVGDYCSLLRSASMQIIYLSQDEDKLYYQFFTRESTVFKEYMDSICAILYDTMRPLVIQMKHMETLAEYCSILRNELLQDHVENNPSLQSFGIVAEQLLRDVQERLVFRAQVYFQTDILQYNPSPGDLAYPEKLEMMKTIADEMKAQEAASLTRYDSRLSLASISSCGDSVRSHRTKSGANSSPADLHGMWYPTLRRTLVCLSRLYRCLEKTVFQGLAQEAILCCTENVNQAAVTIARKKSPLDGQLFHIKHLLILREQIAPFQVDFTLTEMSLDLKNLRSAAYGLFQNHSKLFSMNSNNAILEFLLHGSPLLRETYLDSRKVVDKQLKTVCETFISCATDLVVSPIALFVQQVQEFKNTNPNISLKDEPIGDSMNVQNIVTETVKKVKSFVPNLQHKMDLYLSNPDTQFILYKPIKNNIVNCFSKLQAIILENYATDDQLLIGCPMPEQISILLSSTVLSRKISTSSVYSVKE